MTQASLSPDLHGAIGASPTVFDGSARSRPTSEAALLMIALTSSALVVASVLLLVLLMRNVVTDASLGGFVSGVGIVIAAVGIGGVSYALVTARHAGFLDAADGAKATASAIAPSGMHVVPALPPDLGRRKRRALEAERTQRNRQAKAIASAAAAATRRARPTAPRRPVVRSAGAPRPGPRPPQNRVARTAPPRAARPMPPRQAPPSRVPAARPQAPVRTAITMPRPKVRPPRPAAWPNRAPVVRMAAPPMHPRTQVASFQVNAAHVRAAAPVRPR